MFLSDGLTLIVASIVVGIGTVLAAYVVMKFGREESIKVEQDIARALQQPLADRLQIAPTELEEAPVEMTFVTYRDLLSKITLELARHPAFGRSRNEVASDLMRSYHEQALSQSRTQFWFGVVAATIGFLWILLSGLSVSASNLAGLSRIVPGVIMQATAGLFLKQSSETRQRATDFYDRLQSYEKLRESQMLVTSMRDSRLQSVAQVLLALHMAGASMADITTVLLHENSDRPNTPSVGKG
jgi:hypothetical protein